MPLTPAALEPLLRLALLPGVGPGRLAALVHHFGSAERVLSAGPGEIQRLGGFGAEMVRRLQTASDAKAQERVRLAMAAMQRAGAVAMSPDDLAYPESFRLLPDPPYLLFAAGDLDLLSAPGFALVGTRQPTEYGRTTAAALSAALARHGYVIVSGMAKGIDAAAHAAALDAGAGTVGVLGHGIDLIYPNENRRLFDRVRREGLLLTEFVPGEQPRAGNFPRRNRLIAALSRGVLVVEMGARSGAQHTVTYALDQGKEIFAVPGPIGSVASEGTNQLLKDGARMVTTIDDILEELEGVGRPAADPGRIAPRPQSQQPLRPRETPAASNRAVPPGLSPTESAVLASLDGQVKHVDEISAATGLPASQVLAALLGLELHGLVEALPGKRFRRS